jgi:dienelactone hydrolase
VLGAVLCSCATARQPVSLTVTPRLSLADAPIQIRIAGLAAGQMATLRVSSIDDLGATWQSSSTYLATSSGTINPALQAPVSGSYAGVSAMGPVWSLEPTAADPNDAYFWPVYSPQSFTATVTVDGKVAVRARFSRELASVNVQEQLDSLPDEGFDGMYFQPASAAPGKTAVLVIGGSEGGYPGLIPAMLADSGYPALGVAYFGEPGLPATLSRIPLEYFATALRWLARQPGVNPARIAVIGISRGSEAAQLLGVYYPHLVAAVVASVPSNSAICSYPGCRGPAWMLNGRPVPYTSQFDDPSPMNRAAVIPDQRINGPIFLDCAQDDRCGRRARTPGPSWACSMRTTITGLTSCTRIRGPGTRSVPSRPTSPTRSPARRMRWTNPASGSTCSASWPPFPPRGPSPRPAAI